MKPGLNSNPDDWTTKPSSPFIFPTRVQLDEGQQDFIRRALRTVGIEENPFQPVLPEVFRTERFCAVALYAAVKEATKGEYRLTRTFKQWCRDQGLQFS